MSLDKTQPSRRTQPGLDELQPVSVIRSRSGKSIGRKRNRGLGCSFMFLLLFIYFFAPFRTNLLILGVDDSLDRGELGRTDTIILTTIVPLIPYVGMIGIPRDLWVDIPNVGEQRINTAYFFAEATQIGSGAPAAVETVHNNFGVTLRYYLLLHMAGVVEFVDALGGVDIILEASQGGLPAGAHHLNGDQALTFVRERYNSSDFSRMQQGQIIILASFRKVIQPTNWSRLPGTFVALVKIIDTNIPVWQWPRLGFAFVRAILFGVDNRTITPEMVTPFQTSGGASVLEPNWVAINPILAEMFGE